MPQPLELGFFQTILMGMGATVDWTTDEGRTFQISGRRGIEGAYERFFHPDSHPTRRVVGMTEVAAELAAAQTFTLYTVAGPIEGETKTRAELEAWVNTALSGA